MASSPMVMRTKLYGPVRQSGMLTITIHGADAAASTRSMVLMMMVPRTTVALSPVRA
jgi:hypothetical protein